MVNELDQLKEMMKKQQVQISKMTDFIKQLQQPPRRFCPNSKQLLCHCCQQPGHFAKQCHIDKVSPQVQSPQSTGTTAAHSKRQSLAVASRAQSPQVSLIKRFFLS